MEKNRSCAVTLTGQYPMLNSSDLFLYQYTILCSNFKLIDTIFVSVIVYTGTQTHRQTHTHIHKRTRIFYIVAVYQPQL